MHKVSSFFMVKKYLRQTVLPVLVFITLVVVIASCDYLSYKNPFPDTYFSTNFISSLGFDQFSGINSTIPDPNPETGAMTYVTGSWDFGYRYNDWDGFSYMMLEQVVASGFETAGASGYDALPAGLSADAPVYRLALVNLISDGAFENGISGEWAGTGSSTHDSFSRVSGTGSVKINAESRQSVSYIPQMVSGFTSISSLLYSVAFKFNSEDEFQAKAGSEILSANNETKRATGLFTPATDGQVFSFSFEPTEGSSFSNLFVDDFFMTRSGGINLRLELKPSETTITLERGTYEFSVWVHQDPEAAADGTAASYPLDSLVVTMKAAGNATLAVEDSRYVPSPGWTKVSAILSGEALQYSREDEKNDAPVIVLIIDLENVNPGSILLAAPELRFK